MRGDAAPKIIMTSVEGGDSRDSIITRLVVGGRGLADEFGRRHQPLPHTYTPLHPLILALVTRPVPAIIAELWRSGSG